MLTRTAPQQNFPGEGMVGLKDLHKLTSTGKYRLQVDLKDSYKCYVAVYDNFQVMCL